MISRSIPNPRSIGDAMALYPEWAPDLSVLTVRRMECDVRRAVRMWGTDPHPGEVTTQHFVDLRNELLREELAVPTIEATVSTVWTLLRFLHEIGSLDRVPPKGRALRRPSPNPIIPALEDFGRLYGKAGSGCWPKFVRDRSHWWRTWLAVAYFTGLRLSDVMAFRWDWISRDGVIEVGASKTTKRHRIPMHEILKEHLGNMPRLRSKVFGAAKSSLKCFRRELRAMCRVAGVPSITPQQIRRLSTNEWERARPGCGALIQGSGFKGSAAFYLDPFVPLFEAVDKLRVPAEMVEVGDRQKTLF